MRTRDGETKHETRVVVSGAPQEEKDKFCPIDPRRGIPTVEFQRSYRKSKVCTQYSDSLSYMTSVVRRLGAG